jgi:hypothetical protein
MNRQQRQQAALDRRRRRKARQDRPGSTKRRRAAQDTGELVTVYGVNCTWYDDKANAATTGTGRTGHVLPCCPHCGGMLFEIDTPVWDDAVHRRLAFATFADRTDYPDMIAWARGKCFPTPIRLLATWLERYDTCADCPHPRYHHDAHCLGPFDMGTMRACHHEDTLTCPGDHCSHSGCSCIGFVDHPIADAGYIADIIPRVAIMLGVAIAAFGIGWMILLT